MANMLPKDYIIKLHVKSSLKYMYRYVFKCISTVSLIDLAVKFIGNNISVKF